jgi:hypothetical protein
VKSVESQPFSEADHALMREVYGVLKGQTVETGVNILLNVAVNIVASSTGDAGLVTLKQFCIDMIDVYQAANRPEEQRE